MIEQLEGALFEQPAETLSISGALRSPEDWAFAYGADCTAAMLEVPKVMSCT